MQFVIGQRWISEAEADLGLGIVLDVANRRLTLSFPAAGERRTYALDNAPVSRVKYEIGDKIRHQDGTKIVVRDIVEQANLVMYVGDDEEGQSHSIPEFELDSFVQFSTPRERLFAGQIDRSSHFHLRYQTLHYSHAHRQSRYFGLAGPRVQLLPHQLFIAEQVASRYAPRVLLADEVGLGKTIEAGLILHQQLLTGRVKRALIVVPTSLQHQWLVEMLRRFNLSFTLLDEARCKALSGLDSEEVSIDFEHQDDDLFTETSGNSDNPFESAQLIICSLDFLLKYPNRHEQAVAAGWDMLLVDEAHHLVWSEDTPSAAYCAVEALAKVSSALLLLTATPEQLGVDSHFARLRLLDPDRYYDLEKFKREQAQYQPLNDLVQELLEEDRTSFEPQHRKLLAEYLGDSTADELIRSSENDFVSAASSAVNYLLDRHGTGRVLFRNTRASVKGFKARVLNTYPLSSEELGDLHTYDLTSQIRPEAIFKERAPDWWTQDARTQWLVDWLKANRRKKALVICADAQTAEELEEYLRLRKGVLTGVFHEHMSLIERDRAAAYFADLEEGAQVLVCSEIGSEGRNFQFAHDLVMFDLPINPDLLEQRIGRLDRIGQKEDIQIHVPYYLGTAQEKLLHWYHQGLNAFEKTCAIGQAVFSEFSERLLPLLTASDDAAFEQLLSDVQAHAARLTAELQQGRDKLLELNSCKTEPAQTLVNALAENDENPALRHYMQSVFDSFGVDTDKHSESSIVIRPSDHMRVEEFPGLPEDGLTITFDRDTALSREDIQFVTWEHPLVRGAEELIAQTEFGNTAFCTLKLPPLKPGNLMLEAVYVLHCPAPKELELFRHIPQSLMRVLVDDKGKDLSGVLTVAQLSKLVQKVSRNNAQELVRHARPALSEMLKQAEDITQKQQNELIANAKKAVVTELSAEIDRLVSLAAVNSNVRQSEIDYLKQRLEVSVEYLEQAKVRLDALRVIMTV